MERSCYPPSWSSGRILVALAQDSDIQQQLANPVTSLTLVPIQVNYDRGIGPVGNGSRVTTNVQPVIPFKLNDQWKLVTRTILPLVAQHTASFRVPVTSSDWATRCKALLRALPNCASVQRLSAAVSERLRLWLRAGAWFPRLSTARLRLLETVSRRRMQRPVRERRRPVRKHSARVRARTELLMTGSSLAQHGAVSA